MLALLLLILLVMVVEKERGVGEAAAASAVVGMEKAGGVAVRAVVVVPDVVALPLSLMVASE